MRKILFLLAMLPIIGYGQHPNGITRKVDDFTNKVLIHSQLLKPAALWKEIDKNGISIYSLTLSTYGYTLTIGKRGVIVLFEDGTKWSRNETIDVDVDENGWEYSAYIPLTKKDLELFSTKKIKKFRLYIYDHEMEEYNSKYFIEAVKEIKEMK